MAKLRPQWQRELMNFKGIKSLFVLEKNVDDVYRGGTARPMTLGSPTAASRSPTFGRW